MDVLLSFISYKPALGHRRNITTSVPEENCGFYVDNMLIMRQKGRK
jgi:hypothetical protein